MKKVQLFAAPSVHDLQLQVNEWLALNTNIQILSTNMSSLARVSVLDSHERTEGEYAFYIFYTRSEDGAEVNVLSMYRELPTELGDPGIIESEVN